VPQVADRAEPFISRVRAGLAARTAELERLALEMFGRGLSARDMEAAFRDAIGHQRAEPLGGQSSDGAAVAGIRALTSRDLSDQSRTGSARGRS
jgi:hypothetical protein